MGTDSSNDKQIKQSLLLKFAIIGVVYATISYAFVALVLAFLGRGNASPKVSIWIVALYWGICGGAGGFLWGLICASRAIGWFMERAQSEEPWRGVVAGGARFGIVLGVCMAVLSLVLPDLPMSGFLIVIHVGLFLCTCILVGYMASRAAWHSHVTAAYLKVHGK